MFEKICCIFDSDEQYVVKLMEAMNESMDFPYKVLAYTSESALTECSRKYEVEILITDEDINANLYQILKQNTYFIYVNKAVILMKEKYADISQWKVL